METKYYVFLNEEKRCSYDCVLFRKYFEKDSVIEKYKNCKFIAEFNNIFELLEDIGNNEEICNKKIYWST